MISMELLLRYPIFAGLEESQLATLTKVSKKEKLDPEHYIFRVNDEPTCVYLILDGKVGIFEDVTDKTREMSMADVITGDIPTKEVMVNSLGSGEMFAAAALIPSYKSCVSVKTLEPTTVVAFDASELHEIFKEDCCLGYEVMTRAASLISQRLQAKLIEGLSLDIERSSQVA